MTDKTKDILMLPERWHVLSGSWLKIIAMASMLIDHVAAYILRYIPAVTAFRLFCCSMCCATMKFSAPPLVVVSWEVDGLPA